MLTFSSARMSTNGTKNSRSHHQSLPLIFTTT
jgi:hypothetical protein